MAKKTDNLREDSGIMSQPDKDIVSIVAGSSDDEFVEKYTDKASDADEPDQIRSQIEKTRQEMGETIDEIQERLSYSNISEQVSDRVNEALDTAKATVYQATLGKAEIFIKNIGREMKNMGKEISKSDAGKTVMSNPVPFALIGLGVGALLVDTFRKSKTSNYGNGRNYDSQNTENTPSRLKSAGTKVTDTVNNAYENVSNTAADMYKNASDVAGRAYEGITDAADSAYSSVSGVASQAYEKAGELTKEARGQYDYYIEENPLAVGAVALAVGAAVGFAIPSTRYESKVMGETRDQLLEKANRQARGLIQKAEETAQDTIEKVKNVAEVTAQTTREEAKNQGLAG